MKSPMNEFLRRYQPVQVLRFRVSYGLRLNQGVTWRRLFVAQKLNLINGEHGVGVLGQANLGSQLGHNTREMPCASARSREANTPGRHRYCQETPGHKT